MKFLLPLTFALVALTATHAASIPETHARLTATLEEAQNHMHDRAVHSQAIADPQGFSTAIFACIAPFMLVAQDPRCNLGDSSGDPCTNKITPIQAAALCEARCLQRFATVAVNMVSCFNAALQQFSDDPINDALPIDPDFEANIDVLRLLGERSCRRDYATGLRCLPLLQLLSYQFPTPTDPSNLNNCPLMDAAGCCAQEFLVIMTELEKLENNGTAFAGDSRPGECMSDPVVMTANGLSTLLTNCGLAAQPECVPTAVLAPVVRRIRRARLVLRNVDAAMIRTIIDEADAPGATNVQKLRKFILMRALRTALALRLNVVRTYIAIGDIIANIVSGEVEVDVTIDTGADGSTDTVADAIYDDSGATPTGTLTTADSTGNADFAALDDPALNVLASTSDQINIDVQASSISEQVIVESLSAAASVHVSGWVVAMLVAVAMMMH